MTESLKCQEPWRTSIINAVRGAGPSLAHTHAERLEHAAELIQVIPVLRSFLNKVEHSSIDGYSAVRICDQIVDGLRQVPSVSTSEDKKIASLVAKARLVRLRTLSRMAYESLALPPTCRQIEDSRRFLERHTQKDVIQKLDIKATVLVLLSGGVVLVIGLSASILRPDLLIAVTGNTGLLNVLISAILPLSYWLARYYDRLDWRIAVYKALWIYFASIAVVVAGVTVSVISKPIHLLVQDLLGSYSAGISNLVTSIVVVWLWARAALSFCRPIDIPLLTNAYQSPTRIKRTGVAGGESSISPRDVYIVIGSARSPVEFLLPVFVTLNYVFLWPALSGYLFTDLARYIPPLLLGLLLIIVMIYTVFRLHSLLVAASRTEAGALMLLPSDNPPST